MKARNRIGRTQAVVEVTLAFGLMHLAFRAFKRFTDPGQWETRTGANFSPGLAMIAVALAFIAMRRRPPADFGLTLRPFGPSLNAAFLCLLILAVLGAAVLAAGAPIERPPVSLAGALGPVAVSLAATCVLLWILRRFNPAIERTPRAVGLTLLIGIPLLPLVFALVQQRAVGPPAVTIFWVLGGAGVGEEVFFRGHVQSRLDEAFGRPWRLFGVEFGFGLIGAAALFGLVHVLNGVDYFERAGRPMWWHGLATASTLFYGFLRATYGSVLAPAVVHGFGDLLMRMPRLLAGGA